MTTEKACVIHSYPNNPGAFKALIAAKYAGVQVEVDSAFQMGTTNKTPEFTAKFPPGKVPAMTTPDGPLYESDALATYVALTGTNPVLAGKSAYEKARIHQFTSFGYNEIYANFQKWYYPIAGMAPYTKPAEEAAKAAIQRALGALNAELATRTFLIGERVTLADVNVVMSLHGAMSKVLDFTFRSEFPNVVRWFETCVNQPQFKEVAGEFKFCETAELYDASKFKKEKPKKAEKAAEKKEEKKPDLEAMAEAEKKEEKKKNPLDLLPPSNFVLDAWKRFYSNNDEADSVKWFWENYDPEGFSMWKVDYKYNNELGAIFMSSNLVGGFFQRLDRARKYAFGSMVICGENNANTISGYFVVRGSEVPFEIYDAADYESYNFTKVDPADENVKTTFNAYLKWEGEGLPGKFQDGKIFK